uniref:Uncharacterized protein n=1 Tax=Suizhou Fusar tick virus 1 TaxID=2972103 RepID=A0A9E7V1U4_9VIRU|nr:MAG: hypothetical protein [Suizhou Fusar tick virus 1]
MLPSSWCMGLKIILFHNMAYQNKQRTGSSSSTSKGKRKSSSPYVPIEKIILYPKNNCDYSELTPEQLDVLRSETNETIQVQKYFTPTTHLGNDFEETQLYESSLRAKDSFFKQGETPEEKASFSQFTARELGVNNDLYKFFLAQTDETKMIWLRCWYTDAALAAGNKVLLPAGESYEYSPTPIEIVKPIFAKVDPKPMETADESSVPDPEIIGHRVTTTSRSIQWIDGRMVVPKGHFTALLPSATLQALLQSRITKRQEMKRKADLMATAALNMDPSDPTVITMSEIISDLGVLATTATPVIRKQIECALNNVYESISKGRSSMWQGIMINARFLLGREQDPAFQQLLKDKYPRVIDKEGKISNASMKDRLFEAGRNSTREGVSYAKATSASIYTRTKKMKGPNFKGLYQDADQFKEAVRRKMAASHLMAKEFLFSPESPEQKIDQSWTTYTLDILKNVFVRKPLNVFNALRGWFNR